MGEQPNDPNEPPWRDGDVVGGRYEIQRCIGQGGMGVVFAAYDGFFEREVALKWVRDRQRFEREARITAQISHPNIVIVHDARQADRFIVMERLHGHSLRDLLARDGAMQWQDTIPIIAQVASALACVHANEVVHRDLKPGNIFRCDDGVVKLLDFGLARDMNRSGDVVTETGVLTGTTQYLAPEQLTTRTVSAFSDMHALGVVWWELLVGEHPFCADVEHETHRRIAEVVPPRPDDRMKGIPADVDEVVMRLLTKAEGAERRGTAAELCEVLARFERLARETPSSQQGTRTRPDSQATQQAQRPPSSSRPQPQHWLWASPLLRIVASVALATPIMVLAIMVLSATSAPLPNSVVAMPMEGSKALVSLGPPKDEPDPRLVALGREMFQDTALSPNHDIACSTCHPLANGAMTAEPQTVLGENHARAPWNISSLWNAPLMSVYSWRGDATFADIVERAATKPFLMGNGTVEALTKRVAPLYADKFAAIGVPFDKQGIAQVFEAYLRYIEPRGARADGYFDGNEKALVELERRGAKDFEEYGCTACHQGRGLGGNMMARFGVMVANPYEDRHTCDDGTYCREDADCAQYSVGTCTHPGEIRQEDLGALPEGKLPPISVSEATYRFRVPSLRNVGLTSPYFHDGSARTLEEAVRVMAKLQLGRTLEPREVNEIAAFLRSLSADWSTAETDEINNVMNAKRGKT